MAGPRLLTQLEPLSAASGELTSWFETKCRSQNAALREKFLTDLGAKKRGVTEEKYQIGEVMAELIGPAEHRSRELTTKQESYERILLEKKAATATLANKERAIRLQIWGWKAEAVQKDKKNRSKEKQEAAAGEPRAGRGPRLTRWPEERIPTEKTPWTTNSNQG